MTQKEQVKEEAVEKDVYVIDDVEQLPQVPEITLFDWEVCESKHDMFGLTVSIMDLKLQDLIFEKMYLLFQKLQPAMKNLESAKIELQDKKDDLLLNTDFKEKLNESRPTVAMKEAYIKPLVIKQQQKVDEFEDSVVFYKNKLNILNDLIKAQRTLLDIEGALKQ